MTLRHLQIFKEVCEKGSITVAADDLHMTQPAVSIAIRELEAFYSTKLFERMNRRIYLTETGNLLRQYADSIITQYQESLDIIRNDKISMVCRIGVNVTFSEMYLTQWIKNIKAEIAGIELSVSVDDTEEMERELIANRIDFAVVDRLSERSEIEGRLLYSEAMCVICAPELYRAEMCVTDLCNMPLLLREKGSGNRSSVDAVFSRHGLTAVPFVESISTLSLLQMAKEGLGYAILPKEVAKEEISRGLLCQVVIADESFERFYHLIYHKNKYLTKVMRKAMEVPFR